MNPLTKRTERLIAKYETYITNMCRPSAAPKDFHRRLQHVQHIESLQEMVEDLKMIKRQLQYESAS